MAWGSQNRGAQQLHWLHRLAGVAAVIDVLRLVSKADKQAFRCANAV